jgi:hypothetical protein
MFLPDVGTKFHLGLRYEYKILPRYRCRYVVQPLVLKMIREAIGAGIDNLTYGSNIITYGWMKNDTWRYMCRRNYMLNNLFRTDIYSVSILLDPLLPLFIYLSIVSPPVDAWPLSWFLYRQPLRRCIYFFSAVCCWVLWPRAPLAFSRCFCFSLRLMVILGLSRLNLYLKTSISS